VAAEGAGADEEVRAQIRAMKEAPRGPFKNLRWYCADGTVLPPKAYACAKHGGGLQHGAWTEEVKAIRGDGRLIANVLAQLDPDDFVGESAQLDALRQILLERFLIGWDDGWIFREARSYRGALQSEDEEAGARKVVLAMLADPLWREPSRFFLIREAVALLPVRTNKSLATDVRLGALRIADDDPNFMPLRAKIHSFPDSGDAERVREYAQSKGVAELTPRYEQLASEIDALYASSIAASIDALAEVLGDAAIVAELRSAADELEGATTPGQRMARVAHLLSKLRDVFPTIAEPEAALAVLDTSLALEEDAYAAGNELVETIGALSRWQRLWLLEYASEALYGAGFLTRRHVEGISAAVIGLEKAGDVQLNAYRSELRYLARAPEWSDRWIAFNFYAAVASLATIEAQVHLLSLDTLRRSPLLFYSAVIDGLVLDADQEAGLRHKIFGEPVGAGLRALNPGMARGVLVTDGDHAHSFQSNGIYLLPETTSHLPRVAGILTEGEGSSLSHIQLLARNLGIPNVVVGGPLLPRVRTNSGEKVVLAVSPGGVVELARDGAAWDAIFGATNNPEDVLVIRPDLEKLDTEAQDLLPLSTLRATDSGRTSGPKGANLGELKFAFGDKVPKGFVIPFGVFRHLLDRPIEKGGPSVFEWMKENYDAIEAAASSPKKQQEMVVSFLGRLRSWILAVELPVEFEARLRTALDEQFGADGSFGVFVRSDTNVEDLPGFTGAGLNLTVANVVGYDEITKALREVWASPFTERAYGWRQDNMTQPEFVFPAVVVQHAVPSAKSGVMVTTDVEGGGMRYLSVAVNEGVGGAVDGQATESLRIDSQTGDVQFLAQATAPTRAALNPEGGIVHPPASGTDAVLTPPEIRQLIALAKEVALFESLHDENGQPVPADIEFAFLGGKLVLLQIRPFVESRSAQKNSYLVELDAGLDVKGERSINLNGVPGASQQPGDTQ